MHTATAEKRNAPGKIEVLRAQTRIFGRDICNLSEDHLERKIEELYEVLPNLLDLIVVAESTINDILTDPADQPLDEDDRLVRKLEKSEECTYEMISRLREIVSDELNRSILEQLAIPGDHMISEIIEVLERAAETSARLRWALMEHDADHAEVIGSASTPEELANALRNM